MNRPVNIDRPFFAYGLFRPGQLAFFQLREFVIKVDEPAQVDGNLLLRDGLPIIDPKGRGSVNGALLTFFPERVAEAYDKISAMEPDEHYRWYEATVLKTSANVLVGRSPNKGSVHCEETDWNGWNDPLFTAALDVVEETLITSQEFAWDLKPMFRLQMAYLLLWSSIERYVSLRYHLAGDVKKKVDNLALESAFANSLWQHVREEREVYRADKPKDKLVLDRSLPKKAVDYYYQVRCNIVHRGKGVVRDHIILKSSLEELLPIFRDVLQAAKHDAVYRS